jgi:hypothetical protein
MERTGTLDWNTFIPVWSRIVRRIVLGDSARKDHELTDLLVRLRGMANWSLLHPTRRDLREEFLQRLRVQLHRAEPGSLAEDRQDAQEPGNPPRGTGASVAVRLRPGRDGHLPRAGAAGQPPH